MQQEHSELSNAFDWKFHSSSSSLEWSIVSPNAASEIETEIEHKEANSFEINFEIFFGDEKI